ncbi:ANK [Mytilus edulis]|uniref:ANK n=1 Tax=Mytilus edulis TaxID=6550 RepID=A0A8S3PXH9_MYTED|nr:ANK [Mytilus edulis]
MADEFLGNGRQTTVILPEEERYLRIAHLLVRVAPSAVREKFNREFHPSRLKTELNKHRYGTLSDLKAKHIINQNQWNLLFPNSGKPISETFDLTLMICLIKNLTIIPVGDILPLKGDKSDGAHLTRLKLYRNKIMHSDCGTLSDIDFNEWWDEISHVSTQQAWWSKFLFKCSDLKERRLERDEKDILLEIKNITGMCDPVPKGLRNVCDERILEWKKETVAETRAILRLTEMIVTDNVAVAVGPSGCGKSTAIHFVALQLAETNEYEILIVYNPEEIRQLYNPTGKQVFVIDDFLGVATFDENKAKKWLEMTNDIKIILTKNQIYWDGETPLFKASYKGYTKVVELLLKQNADPNFSISLNWLNQVENRYPGIKVNSIRDSGIIISLYSPQPLSSDTFCFDDTYLKDNYKGNSSPTYTLTEIPFSEGPVTAESYLKNLSSYKQHRFERYNTYKISPIHIAASKGFIDIVKLLLSHNAKSDCDTENQIASPLYIASNNGYTDIVHLLLENKSRSDASASNNQTVNLKELSQSNLESSLYIAVEKGYYDIVRLLLSQRDDHFQYQEHLLFITRNTNFNSNFYWNMVSVAIANDHVKIVKLFLELSTHSSLNNEKYSSVLFQAICQENLKFTKSDPNICNKHNRSPLYVAIWKDDIEIVKLLLRYKSDPDICDTKKQTVLHVASYNGQTEIVKLLLQHTHRYDICNARNQSPLYIASLRGHTDIVKLLLDHNSDPNICNKDNESPLLAATALRSTNNETQELLHYKNVVLETLKLKINHLCLPPPQMDILRL